MSASTAPTWRRCITPAVCLLVAAVGLGLPALWEWAEWAPAWKMKVAHAGMVSTALAVIVVLLWFFCFSGFSARVRLGAVALAVLVVAVAFALVREVDWTGDLRPFPRYRWEPSARQLFEQYREEEVEPSSELLGIDLTIDPINDFPRYRGPFGDGHVTPSRLFASDGEKATPEILWRHPCGGGFSGFAVAGNVAITLEQRRGEEVLVCYERSTGRKFWSYAYEAYFRDIFGDGPRATPTIHNGNVYSLGGTGELVCVEGATGQKRWAVNVLSKHKARPVIWGVSGSPLVVEDLGVVIVCPGGKTGPALAAYDLDSGALRWESSGSRGGYSSPLLATLAGRRQVLIFDG